MSDPFTILDASDPSDAERWRAAWASAPIREVYAHSAYAALYASETARARAALYHGDGGTVLYPFIHRDLPPDLGSSGSDLITPYGYGGPLAWGDAEALAAPFWAAFDAWAASEGVVSEFVRFYVGDSAQLSFPGEIIEQQPNIVVPLDVPPETLWTEAEHKVRKNVKRAQRSGVTVEFDTTGERLDAFLGIYRATMERRDAAASYFFPRDYFEAIHGELAGQFVYAYAMHEGRPVSAELVLASTETLYSFLGGTSAEAFALRPNDLLKIEVAAWGHERGMRRYVLGGGVEAGDGIYRYKRSFAPSGSVPFFVGRRIHDAEAYRRLVERRREAVQVSGDLWEPAPSFFPQYRA